MYEKKNIFQKKVYDLVQNTASDISLTVNSNPSL